MREATQEVKEVDGAARETLGLLARGRRLQPMLRELLLDALVNQDRLDRPADPNARVSSNARAATEWIETDAQQRGKALRELLELADALPPSAEHAISVALPQKIIAVHEALESADLAHAIGGAVALAYYGVPRMTLDIDVNVFVLPDRWSTVRRALSTLDVGLEINTQIPDRQGELRILWDLNPIHLLFSINELHEAMQCGTRSVPFAQSTIPIPAPEHLLIRKATLDRPTDWLDIEQILVATAPLDLDQVHDWLTRLNGNGDPRLARLKEIETRLGLL